MFEKLQAIGIGKEIDFDFNAENIEIVLGEALEILLPLAQYLDREMSRNLDGPIDDKNKKRRAMLLHSGYGWGYMDIMLERSGEWLVRINGENVKDDERYLSIDTFSLAELIRRNPEDLLKGAFRGERMVEFIKKNVFLMNISCRFALIWLMNSFFESVQKQLKEREERFEIMKRRISVFADFKDALDPLATRKEPLKMKYYSIFTETERGHSRDTGDYLVSSALNEFWKISSSREGCKHISYTTDMSTSSLSTFLDRIGYMVSNITVSDVPSLWRYRSTERLPFTKEEMIVLKELARKIEE